MTIIQGCATATAALHVMAIELISFLFIKLCMDKKLYIDTFIPQTVHYESSKNSMMVVKM